MAAEEQKQWDLTKKEVKQLQHIQATREARSRIIEDLLKAEARTVLGEKDWWEAAMLTHNIPEDLRYKLMVDALIGKVWVKGEVPELDKKDC